MLNIQKIISFLFFIFAISQTINPPDFSIKSYTTPNIRASPSINQPNNTYLYFYTVMPTSWSPQQTLHTSTPLPLFMDGSNGFAVEFNITIPALYQISIQFDASQCIYQPDVKTFLNNNKISTKPILPIGNTFSATFHWTQNQIYKIFIWGDNLLSISNVSISFMRKIRNFNLTLISYPSLDQVILITDIQYSSVLNSTEMQQSIAVELSFKQNFYETCSQTVNTSLNPVKFAAYSIYWTNFSEIASQYGYQVLNTSDQYFPEEAKGFLTIRVYNISVDCSVNVNLYLPSDTVLEDGHLVTFNESINQNITFVEQILSVDVKIQWIYHIYYQWFQARVIGLYGNRYWDRTQLQETIQIQVDENPCIFYSFDTYSYITNFYCHNTTEVVNQSKGFISMENYHLRSKVPHSFIYNITILKQDDNITFCTTYFTEVSMIFYEKQHILRVTFNLTLLPAWNDSINYILHAVYIAINGSQVPTANLSFVPNPNNLLIIDAYLYDTLQKYDRVVGWIDSYWALKSSEGYYIDFAHSHNSEPTIIFIPYIPLGQKAKENETLSKSFTQFAALTLQMTSFFTQQCGFFLFSYLISDLIAIQNLAFLYFFVDFKVPLNIYRKTISNMLQSLGSVTIYQQAFYLVFKKQLTLSDPSGLNDLLDNFPNNTNYNRLYDFGYSSDYMTSNGFGLVNIAFVILKLGLVRLLLFIPWKMLKKLVQQVLKVWKEIVIVEVIMLSPNIVPLLFAHLSDKYYIGFQTFHDKANFMAVTLTILACLVSCFIFIIYQKIEHAFMFLEDQSKTQQGNDGIICKQQKEFEKKKSQFYDTSEPLFLDDPPSIEGKESKSNMKTSADIEQKKKPNDKSKLKLIPFLDNTLYFIVPCLVGAGTKFIFIILMTIFTSVRLWAIIRVRKQIHCGVFLKQLLNKCIWTTFNSVYIVYWIIEITQIDCEDNETCSRVAIICDKMETYIFLGGCLLEIGVFGIETLIQIVLFIKEQIMEKCQKVKVTKNKQLHDVIKNQESMEKNIEAIMGMNKIYPHLQRKEKLSMIQIHRKPMRTSLKVKRARKMVQFLY